METPLIPSRCRIGLLCTRCANEDSPRGNVGSAFLVDRDYDDPRIRVAALSPARAGDTAATRVVTGKPRKVVVRPKNKPQPCA